MSNHQVTLISKNVKTDKIPVTRSSRDTCPDSCPFKDGPCYGEGGNCRFHWDRLDAAVYVSVTDYDGMIAEIAAIDPITCDIFRHNELGDLAPELRNPIRIDSEKAMMLMEANAIGGNRGGMTYTHHLVLGGSANAGHNRSVIHAMNAGGFTVNLSADSLVDADAKADLDIGPVVVTLPQDATKCRTPKGRIVGICPAITSGLTCATCKICQKQRALIVGFPAHGARKRMLSEMLEAM